MKHPRPSIRSATAAVVLAASVSGTLLAGCATAPAAAQAQAPAPASDSQAAAQAWAQILAQNPQSNDAALNRRVRTVADRLVNAVGAGGGRWDVRVFVNESPNAFVLPGGRIGVNTGLFKVVQNDDQLAAVLGHEIAHNQYNHAGQRSTRTGLAQLGLAIGAQVFGRNDPALAQRIARYGGAGAQLGFLLPFSRRQELEADRLGVDYMVRAGYRPTEAVTLWRNFSNLRQGSAPQFMSTHPSDATRIQQLEAYIASRGYR
jgi:predicted Zn-dependent protease